MSEMLLETWTPASISALLDRSDTAVERAILALYRRQTDDERATEETKHRNGRGFASCHASRGSYYARWILSGRRLSGPHIDKARKMVHHYTGQLAQVARSATPLLEVAHV